ncbi:MAG: hypothetical protein QM775_03860 [Pirellulales bacterium]
MNAPYRNSWIRTTAAFATATALLVVPSFTWSAPPAAHGAAQPAASASAATPAGLADEQRRVAEKFKRFEQVIKLLAQFSDEADQDQSRLLRQVFAEAQARSLDGKFDDLVKVLQERQLARAAGDQEAMTQQLEELLAMLLSAERGKELKNEQARIKEFIKQIKQMINKQMELEGRTADGDPKKVAPDQDKLAEAAAELAKKMAGPKSDKPNDPQAKPGDKSSDSKPNDDRKPADNNPSGKPKPGEQKPGESQSGKPSADENKPDEGPSQKGKPQQGSPQQGSQQPGPPQQGQQSQDQQSPQNSPQQRVEQAQKRMEEARKRLDEAKREGAMKEQEEAIRELEQAKAELEEILRQLREEEMARCSNSSSAALPICSACKKPSIAIRKVCTPCRSHRAAKAKKSKPVA